MDIGYGVKIDLKPYRANLIQVRRKFRQDEYDFHVLFVLSREQAKELGQMLLEMADAPRVD